MTVKTKNLQLLVLAGTFQCSLFIFPLELPVLDLLLVPSTGGPLIVLKNGSIFFGKPYYENTNKIAVL